MQQPAFASRPQKRGTEHNVLFSQEPLHCKSLPGGGSCQMW